jgi:DNA polymerase IV (DinB-like DNA polymerase)
MAQRIILHADMDCFFAQCEERSHPELKGKPLAVCIYSRRGNDSGAVSASNYPARALGIKSGMPISAAKKIAGGKCIFVPANFQLYESISQSIRNLLLPFADKFEQASIDEAYLDVSARCKGSFPNAHSLALEIKAAILNSESLTCSIGIGPNKLIAKMASDFQKPDGLTIIEPQNARAFLSPLPVKKLLGIGPKTEATLKEMGIVTIGQLSKTNIQLLMDRFGKSTAVYLLNSSLGLDGSKVEEKEPVQISRITSLRTDSRDEKEILQLLDEMASDIHETLLSQKILFKTISLQAITQTMKMHTRSKTLELPTNSLSTIKSEIRLLLFSYLADNPENIRRIGLRISGFEKQAGQKTLGEF